MSPVSAHLRSMWLAVALLGTFASLLAPPLAGAAPGFIEGTVTDSVTHEPLERINVCAYPIEGGSSCALTDQGGSGEYIIAVEPGEYRVGYSSIDQIYLTQFYNGKETLEEGDVISVSEGASASGIDAVMVEGGKITGTVTAANSGMPVQGFEACARGAAGAGLLIACALTDTSGEYTIPGLSAGSYKVEFSPGFCFGCGSESYLSQFYSAKESWADADPVSVSLGATTSDIDVQLIASEKLTVSLAGAGAGTVSSAPEGIDCGSKCSHAFAEGTPVTLTAHPSAGSNFGGWSGGGCSNAVTCQLTMDAVKTVTATFEKAPPPSPPHRLTIKLIGSARGSVVDASGSIACPPGCSRNFADGTQLTLTARPAIGSRFAGWSGAGCSNTAACQITIDADATLLATFEETPTVAARPARLRIGRLSKSIARMRCDSRGVSAGRCCAKLKLTVRGSIARSASGTVRVKVRVRFNGRRVTAAQSARIREGRWRVRLVLPRRCVRRIIEPISITARFAGSRGVKPGHAKRQLPRRSSSG